MIYKNLFSEYEWEFRPKSRKRKAFNVLSYDVVSTKTIRLVQKKHKRKVLKALNIPIPTTEEVTLLVRINNHSDVEYLPGDTFKDSSNNLWTILEYKGDNEFLIISSSILKFIDVINSTFRFEHRAYMEPENKKKNQTQDEGCSKCGGDFVDNRPGVILNSMPPKKEVRCVECNNVEYKIIR
jgi:hypothetical protein